MEKYLTYLFADLETAAQHSPLSDEAFSPFFDFFDPEDEDGRLPATKFARLCDLFGIVPEAFPPEHLLSDPQVKDLRFAIESLWKAWAIVWDMPSYLPERKQYATLVREMTGPPIHYDMEWGAEVVICNMEAGKPCPFLPDDHYCHCKVMDLELKKRTHAWENYARSIGLDPYQDMTTEEQQAFEEEMNSLDWLLDDDNFEDGFFKDAIDIPLLGYEENGEEDDFDEDLNSLWLEDFDEKENEDTDPPRQRPGENWWLFDDGNFPF